MNIKSEKKIIKKRLEIITKIKECIGNSTTTCHIVVTLDFSHSDRLHTGAPQEGRIEANPTL